jgi:hypothetical protein
VIKPQKTCQKGKVYTALKKIGFRNSNTKFIQLTMKIIFFKLLVKMKTQFLEKMCKKVWTFVPDQALCKTILKKLNFKLKSYANKCFYFCNLNL